MLTSIAFESFLMETENNPLQVNYEKDKIEMIKKPENEEYMDNICDGTVINI